MRRKRPSSSVSAPCRLEWRPSRWARWALAGLVPCLWFSLYVSAMPGWGQAAIGIVAGILALREARAMSRRPPHRFLLPWGRAPACVDGRPVADLRIEWTGPLARVSWRRGPRGRRGVLFWPDTLPPAQRRELRLAARGRVVSSSRPGMAP